MYKPSVAATVAILPRIGDREARGAIWAEVHEAHRPRMACDPSRRREASTESGGGMIHEEENDVCPALTRGTDGRLTTGSRTPG